MSEMCDHSLRVWSAKAEVEIWGGMPLRRRRAVRTFGMAPREVARLGLRARREMRASGWRERRAGEGGGK